MAKSLKTNVVISGINAIVSLAFPLITYPYISRVLLPEGVGVYNIAFQIMNYFFIIANLGIPLYATRLVGQSSPDETILKKNCSSIFYINLITTILGYGLFWIYILIDPVARQYFGVYFIMGFYLIAVCLNVEWYYQGTERYGYITIRNIATKILCIVLIFILVKDKDDILPYSMIMVLSVFGYSFFNLFKFIKEIRPTPKNIEIKKHIKPILYGFLLYASSKITSGLDVVMMRYLLGDAANYAVGQYTTATKVINMVIDLLLVINTVMLPRMSIYLSNKNDEAAKDLIRRVFKIIFAFALPCWIGLAFTSKEIVNILSGPLYSDAIQSMIIMSVNVFSVVFINFLGIQVLYAYRRDKYVSLTLFVQMIINATLNAILIPHYMHFGASIATVVANAVALILESVFVIRFCRFNIFNRDNFKVIIGVVCLLIIEIIIYHFVNISMVINLVIKVFSGMMIYMMVIIGLRHSEFIELIKSTIHKIKSIFRKKKNKSDLT